MSDEFRADLLRERYADDPVVQAMIDYIEDLRAETDLHRLPTYSWSSWPTTGSFTTPMTGTGWSITTTSKGVTIGGTVTVEYELDTT